MHPVKSNTSMKHLRRAAKPVSFVDNEHLPTVDFGSRTPGSIAETRKSDAREMIERDARIN